MNDSFSLFDILNFVRSSNILDILVVLLLKLLLVNGEREFLSNKGEFFNRSMDGEIFLNNGETFTFWISPSILRLDGVAFGEGVWLKFRECGFILILKLCEDASSCFRFVALFPELILKLSVISLER